MDKSQVAAVRLGGLGIEAFGTSTFFQLLGQDGRVVYSRLVYNPTPAIKEYFFDKNIRVARTLLSFAGIVITVATYLVDQVSALRKERLRAFQ